MRSAQTRKLIKLLEQEREAILSGALEKIGQITREKEQLERAFLHSKPTYPDVAKVKSFATTNGRLMQSALGGIKAAQERLAALSEVRTGLKVYSEHGKMEQVPTSGKALERKA